jgi:hypothetical protein
MNRIRHMLICAAFVALMVSGKPWQGQCAKESIKSAYRPICDEQSRTTMTVRATLLGLIAGGGDTKYDVLFVDEHGTKLKMGLAYEAQEFFIVQYLGSDCLVNYELVKYKPGSVGALDGSGETMLNTREPRMLVSNISIKGTSFCSWYASEQKQLEDKNHLLRLQSMVDEMLNRPPK